MEISQKLFTKQVETFILIYINRKTIYPLSKHNESILRLDKNM